MFFPLENAMILQKNSRNCLNERENEVIKLMSEGLTSKEIAEKLYLSKRTIDYYRSIIKQKLGDSKKSEIIKYLKKSHDE
jgi:DNA-binding CsgD family transcriptional regulator